MGRIVLVTPFGGLILHCQSYSALKKHIYQLEKKQHDLRRQHAGDLESSERSALMGHDESSSTDRYFIPLLDQELQKITKFYENQERSLLAEIDNLEELVRAQDQESLSDQRFMDEEDDDDDDDEDEDHPRKSTSRERRQTRTSPSRRRTKSDARIHAARKFFNLS